MNSVDLVFVNKTILICYPTSVTHLWEGKEVTNYSISLFKGTEIKVWFQLSLLACCPYYLPILNYDTRKKEKKSNTEIEYLVIVARLEAQ